MKRVKAYLSHPIRGIKGEEATRDDMDMNNYKAIYLGKLLRAAFPNLDLHIPAEMEDFVSVAYHNGCLTEDEILKVDCDIISDCDIIILYNHEYRLGHGMTVEHNYALDKGIVAVMVTEPCNDALLSVENAIKVILSRNV